MVEPKMVIGDKLGVHPAHLLVPILTKFGMSGGLPNVFQNDRSINFGAVGVVICYFPLTRLIAYATACIIATAQAVVPILWLLLAFN